MSNIKSITINNFREELAFLKDGNYTIRGETRYKFVYPYMRICKKEGKYYISHGQAFTPVSLNKIESYAFFMFKDVCSVCQDPTS